MVMPIWSIKIFAPVIILEMAVVAACLVLVDIGYLFGYIFINFTPYNICRFIAVTVHELGHVMAGLLCGVKPVEVIIGDPSKEGFQLNVFGTILHFNFTELSGHAGIRRTGAFSSKVIALGGILGNISFIILMGYLFLPNPFTFQKFVFEHLLGVNLFLLLGYTNLRLVYFSLKSPDSHEKSGTTTPQNDRQLFSSQPSWTVESRTKLVDQIFTLMHSQRYDEAANILEHAYSEHPNNMAWTGFTQRSGSLKEPTFCDIGVELSVLARSIENFKLWTERSNVKVPREISEVEKLDYLLCLKTLLILRDSPPTDRAEFSDWVLSSLGDKSWAQTFLNQVISSLSESEVGILREKFKLD